MYRVYRRVEPATTPPAWELVGVFPTLEAVMVAVVEDRIEGGVFRARRLRKPAAPEPETTEDQDQ
jgi:hypothetical protein